MDAGSDAIACKLLAALDQILMTLKSIEKLLAKTK